VCVCVCVCVCSMLCFAVVCCAVLCCAVLCCAVVCCAAVCHGLRRLRLLVPSCLLPACLETQCAPALHAFTWPRTPADTRLDVECSSNLSTPDLEAEIFLHVLQHCVEYVQAEGDPNPRNAAAVAYADGDGMTRCAAGGAADTRMPRTAPLCAPLARLAQRLHRTATVDVTQLSSCLPLCPPPAVCAQRARVQPDAAHQLDGAAHSPLQVWGPGPAALGRQARQRRHADRSHAARGGAAGPAAAEPPYALPGVCDVCGFV
jgi:hypothetical protein